LWVLPFLHLILRLPRVSAAHGTVVMRGLVSILIEMMSGLVVSMAVLICKNGTLLCFRSCG
jgi:hypothetical protein